MPQVMEGTQPGMTVNTLLTRLGGQLGFNPDNQRFANLAKGWINTAILEIQLADPLMRKTVVMDADFNLIAGTSEYNVTLDPPDGGFGWTNCLEVLALVLPDVSSRPLECLHRDQYRQRSYEQGHSGPSYAWVAVNQTTIKVVPDPDQAYAGKGDYVQNIPQITDGNHQVAWPPAWDTVLWNGALYYGMQWRYQNQPSAWKTQWNIYQKLISDMKTHERTTPRRPHKAVSTRRLRTRRIPHDNSTDYRNIWWW